MLERDLERKLANLVRDLGGVAYKLDPKANKGIPDRVIALPGKVPFFLELKTEDGVVSPLQAHHHANLTAIGQRIVVAYGWDQIRDAVNA